HRVAVASLTPSPPDEAPRGPEFLYSGNRLNVAISRARGLAVLVANEELLRFACRTPDQMRLLNAFCRLAEMADPIGREPGATPFTEPEARDLDRPIALTLGL